MTRSNVALLRLGICSCTNRYQRGIHGQRLTLPERDDRPPRTPRTFQLQVVRITEYHHTTDIRLARCHAFLDLHKRTSEYVLSLGLINLTRDAIGREQVQYGWKDRLRSAYWVHKTPPPTASVTATFADLLRELTEVDLQSWLQRMTPAGWRPQRCPKAWACELRYS